MSAFAFRNAFLGSYMLYVKVTYHTTPVVGVCILWSSESLL